ncbi:MAG: hypothetical protein JRE64_17810 [Deltaproteobacteria bacterium]|nr:hypothetical protein [Deltaproteobacteria bacterium]
MQRFRQYELKKYPSPNDVVLKLSKAILIEAPKVSARATILALRRFGIAPNAEVKTLEKRWKKYSKENDLDIYGKRNKE